MDAMLCPCDASWLTRCDSWCLVRRRAPPGKCSIKPSPVQVKGKLVHFHPKEGTLYLAASFPPHIVDLL